MHARSAGSRARRRALDATGALLCVLFAVACGKRPSASQPATSALPAAPQPTSALPAASQPTSAPTASSAGALGRPDAGHELPPDAAPSPNDEVHYGESLFGPDGAPLPQHEERPRTDGGAFRRRMQMLVDAIVRDDASIAEEAFFPVVAYAQVKDIRDPERDWRSRLFAAFERNVHEYHRALGRNAAGLEFVAIEVDEPRIRWMKPGSEGNRIGYHRALRSRLLVQDAAGKPRTLEITSLISWRGEWYVVHLNGFK